MRKPTIQRSLLGMALAMLISTALVSPNLALAVSPQIGSALNYPNSSERFFNEGQQQFEQELQRLTETPANPSELLHIDETLPTTLEQQRLQFEQPDVRSHDGNPPPSSDVL